MLTLKRVWWSDVRVRTDKDPRNRISKGNGRGDHHQRMSRVWVLGSTALLYGRCWHDPKPTNGISSHPDHLQHHREPARNLSNDAGNCSQGEVVDYTTFTSAMTLMWDFVGDSGLPCLDALSTLHWMSDVPVTATAFKTIFVAILDLLNIALLPPSMQSPF